VLAPRAGNVSSVSFPVVRLDLSETRFHPLVTAPGNVRSVLIAAIPTQSVGRWPGYQLIRVRRVRFQRKPTKPSDLNAFDHNGVRCSCLVPHGSSLSVLR
jgi:hypothetical protein